MASWLNFIKKFPNKLSPLLLGVYNESLQCGSPPETFSKSSVMLLLKKDMVIMLCSYYRPLSLQNVDAKILAKALACRIVIILTNITSMEQTGCFQYSHTFKYNIHLTVYYNPWSGGFTWCTWGVSLEGFDQVGWGYLSNITLGMGLFLGSSFYMYPPRPVSIVIIFNQIILTCSVVLAKGALSLLYYLLLQLNRY